MTNDISKLGADVRLRSSGTLLRGCRLVLVVASVLMAAACASGAGNPASRGRSNDCFTAPPTVRSLGDGSHGLHGGGFGQTAAVEKYLADNRSEAGQLALLGTDRIAVGFTTRGCYHQLGLARSIRLPVSHVQVFRVAHPQAAVEAVHSALIRALAHNEHRDLEQYKLARYGPALLGTEEVRIMGDQPPSKVAARLADLFTNGDTSWFTVSHIDRNQTPTY